ncbi:peptidoglycan-binding protein [Maricaulis sp.]|uniref:peptidoglycan-binding protein n=1 Tax=Maricaulis sp. TaxID=1486257 RepID=UPI00329831FC
MLERVTALLAQSAATLLVVIGLVAILGFTHSRAYRAGYCATQYCSDEGRSWWPFGRDRGRHYSGPTRVTAGPPDRTPGSPYSSGYTDHPDAGSTSYSTGTPYTESPAYPYGETGPTGLPLSSSVTGTGVVAGTPRYRYGGPGFGFRPGRQICGVRGPEIEDADIARCWLRVGDAYQAVGQIERAREAWDEALLVGSSVGGAQASLVAHRRLQAAILERSCPTSQRSLERIAYGFSATEDSGDIVDLDLRQRALSALGYYNGVIDGTYGPMTRRSVRDFQGDMGFDQTGALTPAQTVTLACHAALTARDTDAQNLVGIMFATGLGLEQNIDTALEWLEEAAERGHGGANFNLALIYGTGTVQGSYRLCGIVESPERADSYLRRAADLGHDRAIALRRFAGRSEAPAERWSRISDQLLREAERNGDRFYLAWQRRVDEMRRANGQQLDQPGCYQAALDGTRTAQGGSGTRR